MMSLRRFNVLATALVVALLAAWMVAPPAHSQEKEKAKEKEPDTSNPYLAPKDYSAAELADYLERMLRKPQTIQKRQAFIEAVADGAERILNGKPNDAQRKLAALALFDALHRAAVLDDTKADDKLMHWAEKLKDDKVKEIAAAAGLHVWEKRVMDFRKKEVIDEAEAKKTLDELKAYLGKQKLEGKHKRLCSLTVGLINDGIKQGKNKLFDEFGAMFAKSGDFELARYGRSIAGKPPGKDALAGKPLPIVGKTVDGLEFDIKSYEGKVVLVDFWATWCGPCVRELPHVKANYEKYHKRGFEVVGISLDRERDKLEQFIKDNEIPWVNLYEDDAKGAHPMAKKYDVRAIPTAILVGKDGKVVSSRARGETLSKLLAKLLGEKDE